MQRHIHKIKEFPIFFSRLYYGMEKYGEIYSCLMFEVENKEKISSFRKFLLKYLRLTDTVYAFSDTKVLVVLEETTIRGAIFLAENLRKKIKEKGLNYKYKVAVIQGDFIDSEKKLYKSLKKRLIKAKKLDLKECVHNLEV